MARATSARPSSPASSTGVLDAGVQLITGGRGLVARRAFTPTTRTLGAGRFASGEAEFDDTAALDKLTDVYHSGAVHEEDQPAHLVVTDPALCVDRCTEEYGNPCQHFCPAAVYEWPHEDDAAASARSAGGVVINASNCVHCKTCDVADPYQIIEWVAPEGGGGPSTSTCSPLGGPPLRLTAKDTKSTLTKTSIS